MNINIKYSEFIDIKYAKFKGYDNTISLYIQIQHIDKKLLEWIRNRSKNGFIYENNGRKISFFTIENPEIIMYGPFILDFYLYGSKKEKNLKVCQILDAQTRIPRDFSSKKTEDIIHLIKDGIHALIEEYCKYV